MHGWLCGYETAPLQRRKSTKTTWNSPTVGPVMDCVQTLVIFLLFSVRDFRRGWVLSGACWIFGVLTWMLNSSSNARNPWLHLQKTTGDPETLYSLFRTWKYLLSPRVSFLLLPAAYLRLLSISWAFSTGSFPHFDLAVHVGQNLLFPAEVTHGHFSALLCISSVPFLTQYFPSLPLCLGLFATGYNKPLYLLLPSFFWAKSITLTSYCFFHGCIIFVAYSHSRCFPPHLFHCMNLTLTQQCLLLVPEHSALHCVLFIFILALLLQFSRLFSSSSVTS